MGWSMDKNIDGHLGSDNHDCGPFIHSSDNVRERFESKAKNKIIKFPFFNNIGSVITTCIDEKKKLISWKTDGETFSRSFSDLNTDYYTKFYPFLSIVNPDSEVEISNIIFRK